MSDGIERLCNEHPSLGPLREIGNSYACAAGHACPVDWHVKTTGLPYSSPFARRCPFTGTRLLGAGEILQCPGSGAHEPHDVSMRLSDRPAAVIPMPAQRPGVRTALAVRPVAPALLKTVARTIDDVDDVDAKEENVVKEAKKKTRGAVEHGSLTMYVNYKCRCEKCSSRYREYCDARKDQKKAEKGDVKPRKARKINAAALIAVDAQLRRSTARPAVIVDTSAGKLLGRIQTLREELADAERAFAEGANGLLTCFTVVPRDGVKSVPAR